MKQQRYCKETMHVTTGNSMEHLFSQYFKIMWFQIEQRITNRTEQQVATCPDSESFLVMSGFDSISSL